jgi:hypothetical protein
MRCVYGIITYQGQLERSRSIAQKDVYHPVYHLKNL